MSDATPATVVGQSTAEPKGIRVTVEDLETGDGESVVISDDYNLITAGSCYVDGIQVYGNGTHVITIKGRKDRA